MIKLIKFVGSHLTLIMAGDTNIGLSQLENS